MCALESVYVCGFPPSFSQKEKSHVHSLTRPGRGSIATSWPPVSSKINIWREATVQAGTWRLCELFPSSPPWLPSSLPLHLCAFFMRGGGPCSLKGCRLPRLLLLDRARLGSVRWFISWDRLSGESLLCGPGPACLLWSG